MFIVCVDWQKLLEDVQHKRCRTQRTIFSFSEVASPASSHRLCLWGRSDQETVLLLRYLSFTHLYKGPLTIKLRGQTISIMNIFCLQGHDSGCTQARVFWVPAALRSSASPAIFRRWRERCRGGKAKCCCSVGRTSGGELKCLVGLGSRCFWRHLNLTLSVLLWHLSFCIFAVLMTFSHMINTGLMWKPRKSTEGTPDSQMPSSVVSPMTPMMCSSTKVNKPVSSKGLSTEPNKNICK